MKLTAVLWTWFVVGIEIDAQHYESYYEEMDVVLVQLQVNVRDRDGNSVKGLKKEDFVVILAGEKQRLEFIEEVSVEKMVASLDGSQPESIPQQARRIFVFFFDLRYSGKNGVLAARNAAREFVMNDLAPTDLVAVFVFKPLDGISMVTNFTSDANHLLIALDTLGLDQSRHVHAGPAGYFLQGMLDDYLGGQGTGESGGSARGAPLAEDHFLEMVEHAVLAEKRNYEREVLQFLGSFNAFAKGLGYLRGRKNLIWFSSGFDSGSLVGVSLEQLAKYAEMARTGDLSRVPTDQLGRGDVQAAATEVVESLQGSGVVLFSIDTSMIEEMSHNKAGLQTLNFFSVDTGGRVFTNQNDLSVPLREIKEITDSYYLLSFYPDAKLKKGEVGRLKVKVDRPRLTVYTNKGLMVEPDFQSMSDLEKQIHISEYIGRDQVIKAIPINVSTVEIPMSKSLVKLSVDVEMEGTYFLNNRAFGKSGSVEVHTFAIDKKTDRVFDSSYFKFLLEPKKVKDTLGRTGLKYFANVFVKPGIYKLKVIVRDMQTGRVGSAIEDVVVDRADAPSAGPIVLSDKPWIMLRQSDEVERQLKAGPLDFSYPFQMGDRRLIPRVHPEVQAEGIAHFFFLLNYRADADPAPLPQVRACIVDDEGNVKLFPQNAVGSEMVELQKPPYLTAAVLTVDLEHMGLEEGASYQLLAEFAVPDGPSLRTTGRFSVASPL